VVFYVGGIVPLLIVPLLGGLSAGIRGVSQRARRRAASVWPGGLFRGGAAWPTVMIWVSYFFTLMVVYILINWLPSLLVGQGFSGSQASWVMLALQFGAAAGTLLLGWVMDRLPAWALSALIYLGILASLTALGMATQWHSMLAAGFVAGFFATGGQCVLYALAPHFYRPSIRATGVGSAVAIGRLGAMSGPLVAGKMLALGTGTTGVMMASAPGIVIAALAMFYLSVRRNRCPAD